MPIKSFARYYDAYISGLLLLFHGLIFIKTPSWVSNAGKVVYEPGPLFFPLFTSGLAFLLLALLLGRQIIELRQNLNSAATSQDEEKSTPLTLITCFVIAAAYTYLLQTIGFILGSLLFVPAIQVSLGNRNLKRVLLFSIGAIIVAYLFFIQLLSVVMPRGVGIFKSFSMLFY